MKYKNKIISTVFSILVLALLTYVGCKNEESVTPTTGDNNVSMGFFAENNSTDNTIVIDEAKFLLRKLDLEVENGEDAQEVKLGPFVVYLDLNAKVVIAAMAKIPGGSFDEIHFQIHKPSPQENISDPDFTESTSKRFSVVIKGFFNGNRFVYKSPITIAREIEIENHPVTVPASSEVIVNLTISLNPYSWFDRNGEILDPTDQNNWNDIDHNIRESLKRAFRDMDMNGEPD
jgi:hypothetical protein